MNKRIIISGIIGILVIAMTVVLLSSGIDTKNADVRVEVLTGTPADNYPEIDREKFCGTGEAKSNKYIKEYLIPTDCTQPQAIVTSPDGNVWFAQSNTGRIAKFNTDTEIFTEYDNRFWTSGVHSMIWGLDYNQNDRTFWFTDTKHNFVWRFSPSNNLYEITAFTFPEDSRLQQLDANGIRIMINDFVGNEIYYLYQTHLFVRDLDRYSIPLPKPESVTGAFTLDSNNILWLTNWIPDQGGSLVKLNQTEFDLLITTDDIDLLYTFYSLPIDLKAPNGIKEDNFGNIWMADS